MGQYVPADYARRLVIDFVDVDSAKFEAYAQSGNSLVRLKHAREGRPLRKKESRLAARAHASLLVSAEEAALFAAQRIMPRIQAVAPGANLHIVGRKPTAEVRALDGVDGCKVWGRVDEMPAFLRAADLALVPLEVARGVQNKVLEAMAMALPVVASEGAAAGIGAEPGREIAIGKDDDALVRVAIALLRNPQKAKTMGLATRRFVQESRSWEAVLSPLPTLVGMKDRSVSDAA